MCVHRMCFSSHGYYSCDMGYSCGHVRFASLNTIADLWSAWLLLGVIGGVVVRGVANGDIGC